MSGVSRETLETRVRAEFIPAGSGRAVRTTVPFLDHMLVTLAHCAGAGLHVSAEGDLRHHVIEDVGIAVGAAVRQIVPNECARYAHHVIPMDDALVEVTLDLGTRPYYRGPLPSSLYDHWMRSFAHSAVCTLHVRVLRGKDRHHIVEAAFKGLGFALRDALRPGGTIMSTKGTVSLESRCLPDA
ncbi:MAG: imidazoleglycerol-phosphate dehydratase [Gemmatimonadaceae bacterium]